MISLDGFIEGPEHDLSWHNVDDEFDAFATQQMKEMGMILFGRRTYELMENFWPHHKPTDTENKIVREQMDTVPKIVFSKTLKKVNETEDWKNITLKREVIKDEIMKLKQGSAGNASKNDAGGEGKDIAVLGSSNLCVTLLELGLLDELRIMINPVVIGKGTPLFHGLKTKQKFQLTTTQTFKNGNILLTYIPNK